MVNLHWLIQRVTAVLILPLIIWFVLNINKRDIVFLLKEHTVISFCAFFFVLFHALIGLEEVCVDYVRGVKLRQLTIFLLRFICIVAIALLAIALFCV